VALSHNAIEAEKTLTQFPAEVALIDSGLGKTGDIDLIKNLHYQYPQLICIMMTAHPDVDSAVNALRQGAYDYLKKPFQSEDLRATLKRSANHRDALLNKTRSEEALRHSQKMQAIGQLSGGIAHDFNNQLGIIIGYLDFLEEYATHDKEPQKWVECATRATLRCMDLTRQLLTFSRQQCNKKKLININPVISELETMIAQSVTPAVEVQYFLAEDLWSTEIDPDEFQDTVLNLIINARDAMPSGGKLLIETSNKILDADYTGINSGVKAGEYAQLMISDTGMGMSSTTQERIFEPFYTTRPKGKGTGLGMSMVYGFVRRFNGFIRIHSEIDIGTTFRIYLPRCTATETDCTDESLSNIETPQGNESILIVDDETDLLQLAEKYLSELGYRTYLAENARQALHILEHQHDIDLVFSDVVMPGEMNGYDLAQQITDNNARLKVLLTSGFTSKPIRRNGHSKKTEARFAENMLSKPYRKADLAHRIRLILDEEVYHEPA